MIVIQEPSLSPRQYQVPSHPNPSVIPMSSVSEAACPVTRPKQTGSAAGNGRDEIWSIKGRYFELFKTFKTRDLEEDRINNEWLEKQARCIVEKLGNFC